MNIQELDILKTIIESSITNQRMLAEKSGHSLGVVNRSVRNLAEAGYLDSRMQPSESGMAFYDSCRVRNAVILAAGFGMRTVPVNTSAPKAFLQVRGELMIERQIKQLHAAGITDITVVAGFMMEHFEYLIDKYGVDLVINTDFASRNNLHSLKLAADRLGNTYIIPCDIWCRENLFANHEMYSWYMVSKDTDPESGVRVNRKKEIVITGNSSDCSKMIGITYLTEEDSAAVRDRLTDMDADSGNRGSFWEETLYKDRKMRIPARIVPAGAAVEINTYEQLRELDSGSGNLHSEAISMIAEVLHVSEEDITNITVLKKGMTNRSFLFSVRGSKYIMRIPGEGTDLLINRHNEAEVYSTISGLGLCDDPVYINPENGYKITRFLENIRTCDPENEDDLRRCMKKLKAFHDMNLQVGHTFDIFGQIEYYECLRSENSPKSVYRDYSETKKKVLSLREYIDSCEKQWCLTHIDAVCDNFLFYSEGGKEELQLTDWEYAGMQDPHADIAMFSIYSYYSREQIDHLIDLYFDGKCTHSDRIKIYCYVAACGLLWSNWSEYKQSLGVEFADYGLRQYRYAKEFYRLVKDETGKGGSEIDE